jgi:predicted RNA-binding protein with TRAM domain
MADGRVHQQDMLEAIQFIRDELDQLEAQVRDLPRQGKVGTDDLESDSTHVVRVLDAGEGTKHGDAMTRIDGIVTFLKPAGTDIEQDDAVRVRVFDVGDTYAHATVLRQATEDELRNTQPQTND